MTNIVADNVSDKQQQIDAAAIAMTHTSKCSSTPATSKDDDKDAVAFSPATSAPSNWTTTTAVAAAADPGWHALDISFIATGESMLLGKQDMTPAWRLFLFGNGSPTHHLGLLTGSPTEVDVLGLDAVGSSLDDAPSDMAAIATPRCRRQVWLRNARGERLGYAASWLHAPDVGAVFTNQQIPIGKNILQNKTELFRDMKSVYCGTSLELEAAFGVPGPFWGRSYLFWRGNRPVAFIYEVFSPALERYMGNVLIEHPSPAQATHA